jgi:preprotein translocase subunit SecF
MATLLALGGMLVYIAFRFECIYGVAAVLAVFHDVIVTVRLFSLTSRDFADGRGRFAHPGGLLDE